MGEQRTPTQFGKKRLPGKQPLFCSGARWAKARSAPELFLLSDQGRNPRFVLVKFPRFGNTAVMSASPSPNQRARVAAYCSTEVVGIQRPRALTPLSASSGPPSACCGKGVPFVAVFIP